jgi:DNA repair exonuclease SbcCD ATPase subunit
MNLRRLVLENICQHQCLEHVWHRGLNGIVGPNGSGKSNIIKTIRFAITGQFDNAGTKAENICQLAGDKSRSRTVLDFEHNGVEVEVVRVLRRGVSSCRIGGGKPIDGDNAVTAAVLDLLGVDQRIFSEYIFVPQRRMAAFIDETPGERNKTFGQLFDLARAEAIYRLLETEVKRVNPAPPNPEIESLRGRVADGRKRRSELTAAIARGQAALQQLNPAAARALIDRAEGWRSGQAAVATLAHEVDELAADLEARQADLRVAEAAQAELEQARTAAAADIDAAYVALAGWDAVKKHREQLEEVEIRQHALDAEPAAHPEPQPPENYPGVPQSQNRIAKLGHEIRMRDELLKWFKDEPENCPTCGARTDVILKKAAVYKTELPDLKRALKEAQQLEETYADYGRKHAKWQYWSQDHTQRCSALALDQARLVAGNGAVPDADEAACLALVSAGEELERAIDDAAIRIDQLRQEENRWAGKLDEVSQKHLQAQKALGAAPDPAAVAAARADLERAEPISQAVIRAEGEVGAVVTSLAADEDMLGRLETAERTAETDRLWVYHLGEIRKVMHHDRLPKIVAENYLEILADDTNELLDSFDTDFRVSLGAGLNFLATFLHGAYAGTVSPAQRLSEGQKVLLALAFRVAVNSLFAGTAGLLCLDEPTESLDERNLECLEVAIGKMRDLSESRGIQCLLVTHEPSFEVLFDGVLRLAG